MRVEFTIDEYVYNGGGLIGAKIYHNDDDTLHEILYVKLIKDTRTVKIHAKDPITGGVGEVFIINQDEDCDWEVNNENVNQPTTKKKSNKKR